MWAYFLYWAHNIEIGWEIGGGIFEKIEFVTVLISAGLLGWKKTRRFHKHWNALEEFAMQWAFHICWISFLISTIFVAPFIVHKEEGKRSAEAKLIQPMIYNANSNTFNNSPLVMGNGNMVDNSQKFYGDTNKPLVKLYALKPYGMPPSEDVWAQSEVKDGGSFKIQKGEMIMFTERNLGRKTIAHVSTDIIAICREEDFVTTGLWRRMPPAMAQDFPSAGSNSFYPHWGIESVYSCPPNTVQPMDPVGISTNFAGNIFPMIIREYADGTPIYEYRIIIDTR